MQSFATNLKGNKAAGLRLDIPPHLLGVFKLLEGHANRVRASYKEGMKRSIKFNDVEKSLSLDMKLPTFDRWHRVEPAVARESKRAMDEIEVEAVRLKPSRKKNVPRSPTTRRRGNPFNGAMMSLPPWSGSRDSSETFKSLNDDSFGSTIRADSEASPSREETMEHN